MTSMHKPHALFLPLLFCMCVSYLAIELFYNHYAMLSVDEFWFAHRIYEFKSGLPYRDFAPYKTILGYYLLLPPLLSGRGILQTLLLTKDYLALLNMIILFASSLWLSRFFSRTSILSSLAILIASEIVLSYSTQLRIDLPGYWLGFFSLLLLLEKRYLLAGLLIGLGFITTQKIIWYVFASNAALLIHWLMYQRQLKTIKPIILFNTACAIIILLYLSFWSLISDWNTVMNSVFHEASAMYHLSWYNDTRTLFWHTILLYNPLLFLLWPISFFSLFITYDDDKSYSQRQLVVIFSLVILGCLIPYKQVFPYYMQVTIPVFFILYAALITWFIGLFSTPHPLRFLIKPSYVWMMLACYLMSIVMLTTTLNLPLPYLFICLIPISLILYVSTQKMAVLHGRILLLTSLFMGFIYPLSLLPAKIIWLNGNYQQAHIQTIHSLLQEGGDYVAGIELIYNKTQPIAGLRHLMGPAVSYLYAPTSELKEVMLASLYEDPHANIASVIHALQASSVKFYVNNYRMHALPLPIKNYLHSEYKHWWGSIYLYAPRISEGQRIITIKFTGNYLIASSPGHFVELNEHRYAQGSIIHLQKGHLISNADSAYRLKLIPARKRYALSPEFQQDEWEKLMF